MISRIIKVLVKPRPNDGNMPTQHIPTFLGATFGHGHIVEMYCGMLGIVFSSMKMVKFSLSQQHPTCRNTSQQRGQTHATYCAQQCCNIRSDEGLTLETSAFRISLWWPIYIINPVDETKLSMLQYVALACCDRLASGFG